MSAPIVVKGQVTYVGDEVDVFGWNDMSKGRAAISVNGRFCCSVSIVALVGMYPAIESAGWIAFAQESRIELCALILLMCRHWNAWSPYMSCVFPHRHVGALVLVCIVSRSFRLMDKSKLQLGCR